MRACSLFNSCVRKQPGVLCGLLLASATKAALVALFPLAIRIFLKNIAVTGTTKAAAIWGLAVAGLGLLQVGIGFLASGLANVARYPIEGGMKEAVIRRFLSSSWAPIHELDSGYLSERIESDTDGALAWLFDARLSLVMDILKLVATMATAFIIDPLATAAFIVAVPTLFVSLRAFNAGMQQRSAIRLEAKSETSARKLEAIAGRVELRCLGAVDSAIGSYSGAFSNYKKSSIRRFLWSCLPSGFGQLSSIMGQASLVAICGLSIAAGRIGFEDFFVFYTFLGAVLAAAAGLVQYNTQASSGKAATARLEEILALPLERDDGCQVTSVESLEVRDVIFNRTQRNFTLGPVSFKAVRGDSIGIAGANGSGKTTLLRLLLGIYSSDSGRLLINDQAIENLALKSFRNLTAFVPQDPFLIKGTIKSNVELGLGAAELNSAFLEELANLPDGLESHVVSAGTNLSGGQILRIALARALARKPDILILDEPTGGLDAQAAQLLSDTVLKDKSTRITIIVSHDYETLARTDRTLFIGKGGVLSGHANELIETSPEFRALFEGRLSLNPAGPRATIS
ncbi:MAG: ABC transporter ATP-binding protein [Spirochaetales bacterium]|nr:ABC transporter ATP-binding protein [Spirochaetales bacterium]